MWWLLSAWIAGVFFAVCSWQLAAVGLLLTLLLGAFPVVRHSRFFPVLLLIAGLCLSQWFLQRQLGTWLPAALNGHSLVVTGQVDGLPVNRPATDHRPASHVITLKNVRLKSFAEEKGRWPGTHRVRLYDYGDHDYLPGDRLTLRVKLYRPRGLVNAGSSDGARFSLALGQDASGSVKAVLHKTAGKAPIDQLRAVISREVRSHLTDQPLAADLLPAAVVGDWRFLSNERWQLYQRTGTAHLVVISGGHLTLVAGAIWFLCRFLCVPLLLWRGWKISAQQFALMPALLAAGGYCLLAGWSVSTLRALLMLTVWFVCRLLRVQWPRHKIFALALLAVLLWQPLAPLSNGFWLSFVAVGILFLLIEFRPNVIWAQCIISLVLGAMAAFMFSQWTLVSIVANLLLIPVFSFVIIPVALVGALVPHMAWVLPWLEPIIRWQEIMLSWLLQWGGQLPIPAQWGGAVCLMLAVFVAMTRFIPWPRWSLPFLLLPWLWPVAQVPQKGHFQLLMFDVGEGQATVVRTAAGLVLYDLGPAWTITNAGAKVVRPWLRKQRQPVLLAFASHADDDHAGGLRALRRAIPDGYLFSGQPAQVSASRLCEMGQHWHFAGVDFRVLWPPALLTGVSDNARSCVVKVSGQQGSVLLTGDIPKSVEYWLVAHQGAALKADVLQLPHHGSATSSSYAFLRAVSAEDTLASVGFMNQFNHPAAIVRHKLQQLHISLWRTDQDGMLTVSFNARGIPLIERARARRRPWEGAEPWLQLKYIDNN